MALKVHNDCFPLKSSFRSCKMSILLEIDCKIGGFMSLFELKKCRTIFTYMYNWMFIKNFHCYCSMFSWVVPLVNIIPDSLYQASRAAVWVRIELTKSNSYTSGLNQFIS